MSPVKDLIRLILITLLPVAFVYLKMVYPDFPLSQDNFVTLVLWIVALFIGGWNTNYLWRVYVEKVVKR